jgi:predicted nucleotidyltransferase/predicted transcriptional regulator with HTH domain
MIGILTKSKIRQRIILLFLHNQKKEFYLSEIAKMVGTSPGTAQRELNRLLENDFIIFKKKANLSIYALNKRYSLLKEIETIVQKTFGIEAQLKNELDSFGRLEYAFIFGSYAKGGFKSDSDIDLFLIGNIDEDEIVDAFQKIEEIIGREINYHFASRREFLNRAKTRSFYKEITKDCLWLLGNEDEFKRLIE